MSERENTEPSGGLDGVHDVAVVGFGPVGQMLALLLGRAGHDVVVLERHERPYDMPRAVHFDHEIGRIFQAAGVGDEVGAVTDPVPDHYEWRNARGEALVRIDWSGTGPSGWPTANFFSQPQLEAVLARAVAQLPTVRVGRGSQAVDLQQSEDHVQLSTGGPDREEVRARYVIGADGANSFVRSRMGTAVTDLGFFHDWLIVDTVPHEQSSWSPMNWQLCDPRRPTTIVSGGPGRRRWEFLRLPGESVEELNTPEAAWRLLEPWGRTPENTTLERHTVYTFQAQWAQSWREGRVLIAGDAAHLMPPFAGQGMCSGLRDAMNLAWKLDLVLRGAADPALLDTYTSERSAHVQHAIGMSIALGQVICVLDEAEAAARDTRMIGAGAVPERALPPAPPPVLGEGVLLRGSDGRPAPGAGQLTAQPRVRRGEATGLLDEFTTGGFVLLADGFGPVDVLNESEARWLKEIGASIVALHPDGTDAPPDGLIDIDGDYLDQLRAAGHIAAIVRPDFYLFGVAGTEDELHGLVASLRRQLGHSR